MWRIEAPRRCRSELPQALSAHFMGGNQLVVIVTFLFFLGYVIVGGSFKSTKAQVPEADASEETS